MAALTLTTPTVTGATATPTAVSASDTIDQGSIGGRGAYLLVINGGGSSDTVTIKDFSFNDSGNQLPSNQFTVTVPNGANRIIKLSPFMVDPSTQLVTITHSFTTSVTCYVFPML